MLSKNSSAVALLLGALSAPVSAAVMTSFEYLGTMTFGDGLGPSVPDLNLLPAGGARNESGNFEVDSGEYQAFAANVGYGQVTPSLAYGAGSVAAGDVQVRSRTQMQLVITNDSTSVRTADWQFLIFAGGAGINTPDFNAANCDLAALDQCGTWLNNLDSTADVDDGDLASLSFSTELDSTSGGIETLFSGDISVTGQSVGPAVLASSFSDANLLDGFTSTNMDFSWDETLLNRALGVFQAGETKTLTFVVDTLASATGACVDASGISCVTGYAGFGDPPGGGGRVMYRSFSSVPSSPNLPPNGQVVWSDGTIDAPQGPNPPTAGVPIVSTPLLLLAGLLPALWFRRRRNS